MLRLSSGRTVFFEGIVGFKPVNGGIQIELATKERIDLANITEKDFMTRRSDYFQELQLHATVGEALTIAVLDKLQLRIEDTINKLNTVSIGYEKSAFNCKKSSDSLVGVTNKIVMDSSFMFDKVSEQTNRAAKEFKESTKKAVEKGITPALNQFKSQVDLLTQELLHIKE